MHADVAQQHKHVSTKPDTGCAGGWKHDDGRRSLRDKGLGEGQRFANTLPSGTCGAGPGQGGLYW